MFLIQGFKWWLPPGTRAGGRRGMLREARQARTPPHARPRSNKLVGRHAFWLHDTPSTGQTSHVCPCLAWKPSRFISWLELFLLHDMQDVCSNLTSKHSWRTTLGYLYGFHTASTVRTKRGTAEAASQKQWQNTHVLTTYHHLSALGCSP